MAVCSRGRETGWTELNRKWHPHNLEPLMTRHSTNRLQGSWFLVIYWELMTFNNNRLRMGLCPAVLKSSRALAPRRIRCDDNRDKAREGYMVCRKSHKDRRLCCRSPHWSCLASRTLLWFRWIQIKASFSVCCLLKKVEWFLLFSYVSLLCWCLVTVRILSLDITYKYQHCRRRGRQRNTWYRICFYWHRLDNKREALCDMNTLENRGTASKPIRISQYRDELKSLAMQPRACRIVKISNSRKKILATMYKPFS